MAAALLVSSSLNAEAPQEFAPGIISTGHEFGMAFTPNAVEVYFSRMAQGQPIHIFHSRCVAGLWQAPEKVSFSSDTFSDLDPFLSTDGKHLFFISTRPPEGDSSSLKNMDVWVVDRVGFEWGNPHRLKNVNSSAKEGSPTVARDGTLYFFSDRQGGAGVNAIYSSSFTHGSYAPPALLPPPVNSGVSDTSPWISPDGRTLLFYSTRPGGLGKADLYVAFLRKKTWSAATNLGPVVNSDDSEYNASIAPNGKQLFFGRGGRIYTVPVAAIAVLKAIKLR